MKAIFSLDVECVGLYGDVFSVGVSVIDRETGRELESLFLYAPMPAIDNINTEENAQWVRDNVLPTLGNPNCDSLRDLRHKFWTFYMNAKKKYELIVVADCGSPCESGFFRTCIMDNLEEREWDGPYPLHELGTLLTANNKDPTAIYERLESEMPKHHPLADARQSGRLWYENDKSKINSDNGIETFIYDSLNNTTIAYTIIGFATVVIALFVCNHYSIL